VKQAPLDKRVQRVKLVQLVQLALQDLQVQLDKQVQPVQSDQQEVLVAGFLYLQRLTHLLTFHKASH
jgi:hypothetical protein